MSLLKRKEAQYVLGVAVVLIWGMIIRNVLMLTKGENEPIVINTPAKKEAYNDYALVADTAALQLNYRDPFQAAGRDTVLNNVKKAAPAPVTPKVPVLPFNWSFIKYTGYIRNPGAKNSVTMISINNKLFMMQEGQTEAQVKLIRNMIDSIQISYNGKTTYLKMK